MTSSQRIRVVTGGVVWGLAMALAATFVAAPVQASAGQGVLPPPPSSLVVKARDLGTLPGDYSSAATDINASGLVVGYSSSVSNVTHAALWRRGVVVRLPSPGSEQAEAFGVNDRGFVVGRVGATAALWMRGKLIRLQPLPGGIGSRAEDISNRGLIVGYSVDAGGHPVPVTWSCGRVRALALPVGRTGGHADGVSSSGLVVGAAGPALKWTRGVPSELGALEGDLGGVARSVNDRGVAAGFSSSSTTWPVVWRGSAPAALQTPEGTTAGTAESINRWGNVVGWLSVSGGSTPALWWHGTYVDLGLGLAGRSGYAYAINDYGRVVGWSSYGATLHATLWTVTTPGT